MREIIINKLLEYIRENNPEFLIQLEQEGKLTEFLFDKMNAVKSLLIQPSKKRPSYIIEDACMDILTQDLKPSKYNYIASILEEEFETTYQQLKASGILKFEVLNMITECQSVFDDLRFSVENESNQFLRYAITGTIKEYLEKIIVIG